jgi:mycothiol synthase
VPRAPGTAPATDDLWIEPVRSADDLRDAIAALDAEEIATGVPLVDESERERLTRAQRRGSVDGAHWHPIVARRDGHIVGYAAVTIPEQDARRPVGDAAPGRGAGGFTEVLPALLQHLRAAVPSPADPQIWVRHVDASDLEGARDAGAQVERRLGVLGRALDADVEVPAAPDGVTLRSSRRGPDDEAITRVLVGAYDGTGDGGWDLERFRARQALGWFRSEDLLVAEDGAGSILGIHWLKRRSATSGEVYNLALHPDGQGRGLGRVLLLAGLAHLRAIGCTEVVLWVDLANERAVRLYEAAGFTTRWEDVALRLPADVDGRRAAV